MRKSKCDFRMNFLKEVGAMAPGNSYYDFAELDNFACWVASEQPTGRDQQIPTMAVHGILNLFKQNPTISKRKIFKYILETSEMIRTMKGNPNSTIGLALVVTDYTKMLCIVSGNQKIYYFKQANQGENHNRENKELAAPDTFPKLPRRVRSKHDTIFGALVFKRFTLFDADVFLICNGGFWKKMSQEEIAYALNGVQEAFMFLYNLKRMMVFKQKEILMNYTVASIFVHRVYKNWLTKLLKVCAVIAGIALLGGGVWMYNSFAKIKSQASSVNEKNQLASPVRQQASPENHLQQAESLIGAQEYQAALTEYIKTLESLGDDLPELKAKLQKKIAITELIVEGERLAAGEKYNAALAKYEAAKQAARQDATYDQTGLQSMANFANGVLELQKHLAAGDREVALQNYQAGIEHYSRAQNIAQDIGYDSTKTFLIYNKIKQANGELMAVEQQNPSSQPTIEPASIALREVVRATPAKRKVQPTPTLTSTSSVKENLKETASNQKTLPAEQPRQPIKSTVVAASKWRFYDFNAKFAPPIQFKEGNSTYPMLNYCRMVNGALFIDTLADPAAVPSYKIDLATAQAVGFKFTVAVRAKALSKYGMDFDFRAVGLRERICLQDDKLKFEYSAKKKNLNTMEWHTYCIAYEVVDDLGIQKLSIKVYVDGASIPTIQGMSTAKDANYTFRIGDGSSSHGYTGVIDWIAWKFNEACAPGQVELPSGYKL